MSLKYISKDRIDISSSLNRWDINKLIADDSIKTIQFREPLKIKHINLLNDKFFPFRPDVEFRIYGFYKNECDLSFLNNMNNVKNLSVDSLISAKGVEYICQIPKLKSLSIGIFNLENFDFLNNVSDNIEKLFIGATRSKKPKLDPIVRFKCLKELYLEGQQNNIDVISHLNNLEDVTLRSITLNDLKLLIPLKKLWSLDIKLGGTKNLDDLKDILNLKYLELWQIRGLSDISVISTLFNLQYLYLQSLPQIKSLPHLDKLNKLRRIYLEQMKGLSDVTCLKDALGLEEFVFVQAQNMEPEAFIPLLKNITLKSAGIWFGSNKKNKKFESLLKEFNIKMYKFTEFVFK